MKSQYDCKLPSPPTGSLKLTTRFVEPSLAITQITLWSDTNADSFPDTPVGTIKKYTQADGWAHTTVTLGSAASLHGKFVEIVWRVARVPQSLEKVAFTLRIASEDGHVVPLLDGDTSHDELELGASFAHDDTKLEEFQTRVRFV